MEQSVINIVGSLGFPIFTAIYFMTRMESQLKKNNELLAKLYVMLDRERVRNG